MGSSPGTVKLCKGSLTALFTVSHSILITMSRFTALIIHVQVGIRTKHPLATDHVPINYSRASVEAGGRARHAEIINPHQLARWLD